MNAGIRELVQKRLRQAREALGEARAIHEEGMDIGFVLTSLFFAFYYPVIALVCQGRVPESMQRVTIGLFEQQYVDTGIMPQRFSDGLRRIVDLNPECSGGRMPVSNSEVEHLLLMAEDFISTVGQYLAKSALAQS